MEAGLGRTLIGNAGTVPELSADARAVLESISDAFYALDGAWRIVYVNRRALTFWGLAINDVIGHVLWDRLPQIIGTRNESFLRRARAERREIEYEATSVVTGAWIHVTALPAGGGVHVYFRDITPRVHIEQTLRANEEHLRLAQEAAGIGMW
ncbi:MAG: PAS domain-containing protein, partial [Rhodanobacteraceae bacterium]